MGLTLGQRRILDSRSIQLVDAVKSDLGPDQAMVASQILLQVQKDIRRHNTTFIDGLGKFGVNRGVLKRGCGKLAEMSEKLRKLCGTV